MAGKNIVLKSINIQGAGRCVDIFMRPDETFGFAETQTPVREVSSRSERLRRRRQNGHLVLVRQSCSAEMLEPGLQDRRILKWQPDRIVSQGEIGLPLQNIVRNAACHLRITERTVNTR